MNTRNRKLKKWNGVVWSGDYKDDAIYVAATSQVKAAKLVTEACKSEITITDFRNHYSEVWGIDMQSIEPQEPCVYVVKKDGGIPTRIL